MEILLGYGAVSTTSLEPTDTNAGCIVCGCRHDNASEAQMCAAIRPHSEHMSVAGLLRLDRGELLWVSCCPDCGRLYEDDCPVCGVNIDDGDCDCECPRCNDFIIDCSCDCPDCGRPVEVCCESDAEGVMRHVVCDEPLDTCRCHL